MGEIRRWRWNGQAVAEGLLQYRALVYRPGGPLGQTRQLLPLLLALACLFAGWDELCAVDWRVVRSEVGAVSAAQWCNAAAAAAVSYLALGRYDAVMHRLFATGIAARAAVPAGSAAIAIGQTTGFGLAVGAVVRWRLLPQFGFAGALRLTIAVSLSFIVGWALVTALCIALFLPAGGPWDASLRSVAAVVLALAAAILSYRLVYCTVPALLAGALLVLWPGSEPPARAVRDRPAAGGAAILEWLRRTAPRAESLILAQGGHRLLRSDGGAAGWVVGTSGQTMAALFDPAGDSAVARRLLTCLAGAAAAEDRVACVYKAGARTAALARRTGWAVRAIADDCWLTPAAFSLDGPARANLRRKLRHAAAAGVTASAWKPGDALAALPVAAMEAVASHWAKRRGGERGFSMGRFDPSYVSRQRVYLARADGEVLAFATFHQGAREWALDLMRHHTGAPDGTMACLVTAAIADAREAQVGRLSLAAVPFAPAWPGLRFERFLHRLSGGEGLCRFKALFAPERDRLYIAAQSRAALAVAAFDLARAIRFPGPLPAGAAGWTSAFVTRTHDLHEELAFDNS